MGRSRKRLHANLLTLSEMGIELTAMSPEERVTLAEKWDIAFSGQVTKQHGIYKQCSQRWCAYSFELMPCMEGKAAMDEYRSRPYAPYYLFDESMEICGLCEAGGLPDLSSFQDDLYVVHHQLRSTMAFTHEQEWGIGPYFARAHNRPPLK